MAQGARGSVTGLVADPAGSVVPGASVTVRSRETNEELFVSTTGGGAFTLPSVRVGSYNLEVAAPGFQVFRLDNVRVETAAATRVNVTLQIGATTETVSVTADLPLLQAETSSVGTVVNRGLLDRVPFQLAGTNRDVTSFIRLVPGVSGNVNNFNVHVTGGRQHASEVLIDGVTNTYRGAVNEPFSVRPSMTSVAEFRVETAVPPAEYGRTSSGVVIMTTKSGTNQYHGNLEFLLRNNVLDSRRFNARIADITRQGEGAVNFGGPVLLPGVYNGKDRTFFFFDFTGFRRINQPQGVTRTIATNAMREGDFSATGLSVFDPLSGATRTQFPGNRIPAARFSSFGRAMLDVIPAPNLPTAASNIIGSQRNIENMKVMLIKIDHRFNDRHQATLIGRPSWNERNNFNGPWEERLEGFFDKPYSPHVNLSYDAILKPNLLNRVTVGWTNWFSLFLQTPHIAYQVPGAFGSGFPAVRFQGQGLAAIGENVDRTVGADTINVQNALSYTVGRHNWKFGFRFDRMEDNTQTLGNQNGTYTFSPFTTSQPGTAGTGHAFASMLLGAPNVANMQFGLPILGRSNAWGFYAQDDWKVTSRLTLNYGLRYEFQQPWYDRDGNESNLDLTQPNPAAGGLPGIMVFSGNGSGRSGSLRPISNYMGGLGPRLGLAYQLTPSMVIRAGAGVFYAPRRLPNVTVEGFSSNITLSSLDGGVTPAFFIDGGWPDGVAVKPPFISPTLVNGRAASYRDPDADTGAGRLARTHQFQFSIQQRVRTALFEAGWVSTQGRHIPNNPLNQLNQVDPRYLGLGDLLRQNINSSAVAGAGFSAPFPGFQGTLAQALRPFPQFQGITGVDGPTGNSNYHALLLKFEQRFSSGLALLGSYTFSKFIADADMQAGGTTTLQDAYNRRAERSITNIDQPQRFIASVAYELPFGRGKAMLSSGWAAHVFGGFAVSGIFTYEAGVPLRITVPNGLPLFNGQLRPDRVAGADPFVSNSHSSFRPLNGLTGETGDVMLNRAAFAVPAPFTFGNLGPFLPSVRAFGFSNEDISISKRNFIGERQFIEFRTDWFNAPNRTQLNAPITDLTNPNFGRITSQRSARIIQLGIRYAF
ncbi:MAG: TonB-dependent receptor [Bryobacterales bacterium]|nr:TonB-dependent receptor [Bryobacterales bacterium]